MQHTIKAIRNRWVVALLILCGAYFGTATKRASAACWSPFVGTTHEPVFNEGGWNCQSVFIDYWWSAFNMQNWGDFGYNDPCANWTPLGRTFNALFVLGYSSTSNPHCNKNVANMTEWAMCWSNAMIAKLVPGCETKRAYTDLARKVTLHLSFHNDSNPVARASTIFHEARHASACPHNANASSCDDGGSCDKSWTNGCPAAGNDAGANRYGIQFMAWYLNTAKPNRINSSLRTLTRAYANARLAGRFKNKPCHRYDDFGIPYTVPC